MPSPWVLGLDRELLRTDTGVCRARIRLAPRTDSTYTAERRALEKAHVEARPKWLRGSLRKRSFVTLTTAVGESTADLLSSVPAPFTVTAFIGGPPAK